MPLDLSKYVSGSSDIRNCSNTEEIMNDHAMYWKWTDIFEVTAINNDKLMVIMGLG